MASVTDCLVQIQELTRKNLEILKVINDSFFTKQNHLAVNIGDTQYVIPSFISLENKINSLQDAFNNIVNAPSTGEAYFNMDGNSRAIEVRGYTHTPNSLTLNSVSSFEVESNDIFKDFLTPVPYVNFSLSNLPNDITTVNVKKIIPKNSELINFFIEQLGENVSVNFNFSDLYKKLSVYKEDKDFISYDVIKKLPIRKNIGSGTYVIESIIDDVIDKNLDEYITLKLRTDINTYPYKNNLTYQLFDETIEKSLKVGDQLVTFDDSAKMEITEIRTSSNTIVVKVLNGEYLNLIGDTEEEIDNINDLAKIKFFSPVDFDEDKYINVPLEEDQYIFVAVAPLNDRMNIQSPWGSGVIINTYLLQRGVNGENFKTYYDENVRNIGDTLYEITAMMSNTINKYSYEEFNKFINFQPVINTENLQVTQINKHLNDSVAVKNIRALYSQKKQYNIELTEVQSKIAEINDQLSSISFDDTSNMRSVYTAQLTEYNQKKNELVSSITKIIDEISLSANNSEIPIENAKYRIRGYFDYESFIDSLGINYINKNSINGIKVQYRYKNLDQPQSNAQSFNGVFTFSDWVDMDTFIRPRVPQMDDNGNYKFNLAADNSNQNEPSFNQIDIPISQGETVDIRLKVIYDFGYPFIETTSMWSEIVNIEFPKEYLKDVQILDIIEENNNDIETNRFQNIIKEQGIPEHIDDKIIDQDITYFHKPENIASGFYTAERRIIPLKDKLLDIDNIITQLQDEVLSTSAESLKVDIVIGDVVNRLQPYQTNNISVEAYNTFTGESNVDGVYTYNDGVVSVVLNLIITNESQHSCKLFSLFPGPRNMILNKLTSNTKFDVSDYVGSKNQAIGLPINPTHGVWMRYKTNETDENGEQISYKDKLQGPNQFITFRVNNPYDGTMYYKDAPYDVYPENDLIKISKIENVINSGAVIYPYISSEYALCLDSDTTNSWTVINSNESIVIPILFEYKLDQEKNIISKIMSFDLRTSLYADPINYTFKVIAKYDASIQDKVLTTNRKYLKTSKYNTTVVK